jgi:uncharacterized protein (DUF1330 family)
MPAYMVFEVTFADRAWRKDYVPPTLELIAKHGGRPLAGATPEKLEGDRAAPTMVVILEFPTVEAAKAWHRDPDYQPLAALRLRHAPSEGLLVPGVGEIRTEGAAPGAAYAVFEVTIQDASWREKYAGPTARLVARHGGRYLARGPSQKVEGSREAPTAVVILEFPSAAAARAWHADPDYQPLIRLRSTGSTAEALLVPGL